MGVSDGAQRPVAHEGALDPRGRRTVAGVWAFRSYAEQQASLRFARLARQLREHDAAPAVVEIALRAESDELRHIAICADVARRYGHDGGAYGEEISAGEIGPRGGDARERLLYEVVAFCCVTESINAALMTVSFELAEAPVVRAAVREILRDEVAHSRLGWAHLASERRHRVGGTLASALPAMLAGTVREELFAPGIGEPGDERLAGHGELPIAMRREIFARTLREVVFPGLVAQGIAVDAGERWLAERARS